MIDISVLQQYSLLDGLEKEQIEKILPLMEEETFDAGTDIIVEGKRSDKLRIILEGRVAVVKNSIILVELDKGDVFGEMEILDVGPAEATITSLAHTKVLSLSIDTLGEIFELDLKIHSFLLMNLARDLSRRLRKMDGRVTHNSPLMDWN